MQPFCWMSPMMKHQGHISPKEFPFQGGQDLLACLKGNRDIGVHQPCSLGWDALLDAGSQQARLISSYWQSHSNSKPWQPFLTWITDVKCSAWPAKASRLHFVLPEAFSAHPINPCNPFLIAWLHGWLRLPLSC